MSVRETILMRYTQIPPKALKGKRILHVHYQDDTFILLLEGQQYVKIESHIGWDEDSELEENFIRICDLRVMGVLTENEWAEHQKEEENRRISAQEAADIDRFKRAAAQVGLGVEAVEKLLRG